MLCNPLLTCTKSVNQVMSASNRPQLLKLRWFEVSKNLLTWAHSEFETEVSFSPTKLALLVGGKHAVAGAPGLRPCFVQFLIVSWWKPRPPVPSWLRGTLGVLQNFKEHRAWAGFWREDPRAITRKCFNRTTALGL